MKRDIPDIPNGMMSIERYLKFPRRMIRMLMYGSMVCIYNLVTFMLSLHWHVYVIHVEPAFNKFIEFNVCNTNS